MLTALLLASFVAAPDVAAQPAAPVASPPVATPAETAIAAGVPAELALEVAARAAERGADPAAALAPIVNGARAGVPPEPVAAKVLEGLAKGIPVERVAAVAAALADRLGRASALRDGARDAGLAPIAGGRPSALADLADALGAGVPDEAVAALVAAARVAGRGAESAFAAARTLAELARRGVPVPDALPLAVALAGRPPLPPGHVAALYDAYRREGGEGAAPFLDEARKRASRGERLEGMVDPFGQTPDRVNRSRPGGDASTPSVGRGHGAGHEPGAVPGLDGEPRGRARGHRK
jgi:hypothetical protein